MASCHGVIDEVKGGADLTIALAGNPNVGKSSLFNQLTGLGVITANYPGKTVELNAGTTERKGRRIAVLDLPGTYALGAVSEDQWVARRGLLDGRPDVVIAIVDATNLERNLHLVLQLIDMELPVMVALNLVDQAEAKGILVSSELLSQQLGVPVVRTVAVRGEGVDRMVDTAIAYHDRRAGGGEKDPCFECSQRMCTPGPMYVCTRVAHAPLYSRHIVTAREKLAGALGRLPAEALAGLPPRAVSILLLEQDPEFTAAARQAPGGEAVAALVNELSAEIAEATGEAAPLRLTRERNDLAAQIARTVRRETGGKPGRGEKLWDLTVRPATGLPILGLVLAVIFAALYFGGNSLSILFSEVWTAAVSPIIAAVVTAVAGEGIAGKTLLWGLDAGVQAALAVGISYVLVFYLILAVLEDTGYFSSVAFLTDSIMHRFGLHGRAAIPLLAAAGCNVPAITGTRVLTTMRERVIASTLIVLIPCGARTAVILGAVGHYAGPLYAAAIFGLVLVLVALVGVALNAMMPGQGTGIVMEMFPFRMPDVRTTLKKTWYRTKDFVVVAMPIVLVGSLGLGLLYETGWVWSFSRPLAPIVEGWLGLPAVAGLTLLFAVLRKELALQLLVTLAIVQYGEQAGDLGTFMTSSQLFVYGLVNTIYIPCIATIAVLGRELGWRRAAGISAATVALALAAGGVARIVLA